MNLERKLVVLLIGCKNLPAHRATGVNDAYVTLKLFERFDRLKDEESDTTISGGGGGPAGIGRQFQRRRSTMHRRSTTTMLNGAPLTESCVAPLEGQTSRDSVIVQSTSNPEYNQVFVFDHLPIPLRRQSQSVLLNHSLTGGSNPMISRQVAAAERGKMNPRYYLQLDIMDTTTAHGAGERYAHAEVLLNDLPQGRRSTLWVDLTIDTNVETMVVPKEEAIRSLEGLQETTEARNVRLARSKPKIGIVLEPTHFGLMEETVRNESRSNALLRALHEELSDVFSAPLLQKIHEIFVFVDEQGVEGLVREDVVELLEELYFFTGTSPPLDEDLMEEVKFLFALFDKQVHRKPVVLIDDVEDFSQEHMTSSDGTTLIQIQSAGGHDKPFADTTPNGAALVPSASRAGEDDVLPADPETQANISEVCGILKMSKFAKNVSSRWLKRKEVKAAVGATTVGALWDQGATLPAPGEYAGFRRPNGAAHERMSRISVPANIPKYAPKPYRNLYEELYGQEEQAQKLAERAAEIQKAKEDEQARQDEEDHKKGFYRDDTTPMFVPKAMRNICYTEDRELKSLAQLFAPSQSRNARDPDLISTFHEPLVGPLLVESVQLQSCEVDNAILFGCRIYGGVFRNCSLESCIIEQGAEIVDPKSMRCCECKQVRVSGAYPVNSRFAYSVLRRCPLVAQCSLTSTDVEDGTALVFTSLTSCTLDATVKDEGANKMNLCRLLGDKHMSMMTRLLDSR